MKGAASSLALKNARHCQSQRVIFTPRHLLLEPISGVKNISAFLARRSEFSFQEFQFCFRDGDLLYDLVTLSL
jgi:hypothetical protein